MMRLGKSKLPWIIMAVVMILMFSQGIKSNNMMIGMMIVMAIIVMIYQMNKTDPNP
jgi:hypothetical protein